MAIDRQALYEASGQKYAGLFKRAYTDLGVQGVGQDQLVQAGRTYADTMLGTFLPEFQKQTGREPTIDEISDFLDNNISPTFAAGLIEGTVVPGQVKGLTNNFLEANIKPAIEEQKLKET